MTTQFKTVHDDLSPKERSRRYSKGEVVDRIPVTMSLNESFATHYGFSLNQWYHDSDAMVKVEELLQRDFAFDNVGIGLGLRGLCEALGTEIAYFEDSISTVEKPAFKDYKQINETTLVNIKTDGRLPQIIKALKILNEKFGKTHNVSTGIPGPITTATFLIGTERFLKDIIKDQENITKLLRFATENYKSCAKQIHDTLGVPIGMPEPMVSRDLMSLRQFRKIAVPFLEEVCSYMKDLQGEFSLHICGHTNDRWADLNEIGFDAFSMDNCESMAEFKELYGNKMGLSGNVPPVEILRDGSQSQIEQAVKQCLLDASDNPRGFTLTAGCDVPIGTPPENLLAFKAAAQKFGKGAKLGSICEGVKG